MDSLVSPKDEIWFLRVCHHISNTVYKSAVGTSRSLPGPPWIGQAASQHVQKIYSVASTQFQSLWTTQIT